jgi:hypothetical protein
VDEVANALLALMFDGVWANIFGRSKERLGEGKGTAVSASASMGLNESAGFLESQGVSRDAFGFRCFLREGGSKRRLRGPCGWRGG